IETLVAAEVRDRLALDQLHREIGAIVVGGARVEHLGDRRVLHLRERLALDIEIRACERTADLSADHLERDFATYRPHLFGEIHATHAALAEDAADDVGSERCSRIEPRFACARSGLAEDFGRILRRTDGCGHGNPLAVADRAARRSLPPLAGSVHPGPTAAESGRAPRRAPPDADPARFSYTGKRVPRVDTDISERNSSDTERRTMRPASTSATGRAAS